MKLNIFTLTLGLTLACAYTPQAQPADSCNPLSMLQERRSTCVLKFLYNGEYHIQKIDLKKILSLRNGMHHGINGLRELCDNSIVYVQRNTTHLIKNIDAIPFISAVLIGGALLFIIYIYKNQLCCSVPNNAIAIKCNDGRSTNISQDKKVDVNSNKKREKFTETPEDEEEKFNYLATLFDLPEKFSNNEATDEDYTNKEKSKRFLKEIKQTLSDSNAFSAFHGEDFKKNLEKVERALDDNEADINYSNDGACITLIVSTKTEEEAEIN